MSVMQVEVDGLFERGNELNKVQNNSNPGSDGGIDIRHQLLQSSRLNFERTDILTDVGFIKSGPGGAYANVADINARGDQAEIRDSGEKTRELNRIKPNSV